MSASQFSRQAFDASAEKTAKYVETLGPARSRPHLPLLLEGKIRSLPGSGAFASYLRCLVENPGDESGFKSALDWTIDDELRRLSSEPAAIDFVPADHPPVEDVYAYLASVSRMDFTDFAEDQRERQRQAHEKGEVLQVDMDAWGGVPLGKLNELPYPCSNASLGLHACRDERRLLRNRLETAIATRQSLVNRIRTNRLAEYRIGRREVENMSQVALTIMEQELEEILTTTPGHLGRLRVLDAQLADLASAVRAAGRRSAAILAVRPSDPATEHLTQEQLVRVAVARLRSAPIGGPLEGFSLNVGGGATTPPVHADAGDRSPDVIRIPGSGAEIARGTATGTATTPDGSDSNTDAHTAPTSPAGGSRSPSGGSPAAELPGPGAPDNWPALDDPAMVTCPPDLTITLHAFNHLQTGVWLEDIGIPPEIAQRVSDSATALAVLVRHRTISDVRRVLDTSQARAATIVTRALLLAYSGGVAGCGGCGHRGRVRGGAPSDLLAPQPEGLAWPLKVKYRVTRRPEVAKKKKGDPAEPAAAPAPEPKPQRLLFEPDYSWWTEDPEAPVQPSPEEWADLMDMASCDDELAADMEDFLTPNAVRQGGSLVPALLSPNLYPEIGRLRLRHLEPISQRSCLNWTPAQLARRWLAMEFAMAPPMKGTARTWVNPREHPTEEAQEAAAQAIIEQARRDAVGKIVLTMDTFSRILRLNGLAFATLCPRAAYDLLPPAPALTYSAYSAATQNADDGIVEQLEELGHLSTVERARVMKARSPDQHLSDARKISPSAHMAAAEAERVALGQRIAASARRLLAADIEAGRTPAWLAFWDTSRPLSELRIPYAFFLER
ncbi:hypothetical protein H696_00840 [Fonticula alba]|uniref:Uncharacterized protein n=1 Tax=Fonticula alba TaxID=691883 RepID=A0A058ZG12_FONAL|nr:hypothetical protein H696_00840 [Fonticula alba]KCV73299.1 hypothetical protein H696_00840 [Fonticula alba]|eukprot:XP_009493000.1 hypothetical protein H696_00840 [Fonticula alba]